MRLLGEIALGLAESVRETLPSTEDEAGPFLAGMVWAFVLFWTFLILTTWLWLAGFGR